MSKESGLLRAELPLWFDTGVLVLSPEGMAAIKSAMDNKLQRPVNIAPVSALSTIGLSIPGFQPIATGIRALGNALIAARMEGARCRLLV